MWRMGDDVNINDIVRETVTVGENGEEQTIVDCAWGYSELPSTPNVVMDGSMADFAHEFMMTGDPDAIYKLFTYDLEPPLVKDVKTNDYLSYYEHQLFASDKISKPYVQAFNSSAGTVSRMFKHQLKPTFLFTQAYYDSGYVQETVMKRINELYSVPDINAIVKIVNVEDVQTDNRNHCYYGRNANLMKKKFSHAFEVNPYSTVLVQEEKLIGLTDTPNGYRVTYRAGDEKVQYEYCRSPEFYRLIPDVFDKYFEVDEKYAFKRNDVYVYATTIEEYVLKNRYVIHDSPIVFPDPIQYPDVKQVLMKTNEIPSEYYREVFNAMGRQSLFIMVIQSESVIQVVDIDVGGDHFARQTCINNIFGDYIYYHIIDKTWHANLYVDIKMSNMYCSPSDNNVVFEIDKTDNITAWGDTGDIVNFKDLTLDLAMGSVSEAGRFFVDIDLPVPREHPHFTYYKTLIYTCKKNFYGYGSYIDTTDFFSGNKFGD